MAEDQSSLNEEQNTSVNNEALINEKIRRTNIKSISSALIGSIIVGILAVFFNPFADPFFGILPVIAWTIFISTTAFSIIYQLLFYWIGKDVAIAAKKQKKYMTDRLFRFCRSTSFSSEYRTIDAHASTRNDPVSDPSYRHLPFNTYYNRDQ
jgi:hypothetical protein